MALETRGRLPRIVDSPSYRPISLANAIYKLYAALLQARLAKYFDSQISEFQYGFRKKRSTATPLFLIRRMVELFERHATSLYVLFLDWSQPFDCISHDHLTALSAWVSHAH